MKFHDSENPLETQNHLAVYTMPVFLYGSLDPTKEKPIERFSAVAVRIATNYFLLTAGHCVKLYRRICGQKPMHLLTNLGAIASSSTAGLYPCLLAKENCVTEEDKGLDIGYFEIPSVAAKTIETHNRLFLPESRIEVREPIEYMREENSMMLYGYPAARTEEEGKRHWINPFTIFYPNPSPVKLSPESYTFGPAKGVDVFDFAVTNEAVEHTGNDQGPRSPRKIELPSLSGASGCGWWYWPKAEEGWAPEKLRLVGIYFGRLVPPSFPRIIHRSVMVKHHLRLIAEDYPQLREHIYDKWPSVKPAAG